MKIEAPICQVGRILYGRKSADLAGEKMSGRMDLAIKILVNK